MFRTAAARYNLGNENVNEENNDTDDQQGYWIENP